MAATKRNTTAKTVGTKVEAAPAEVEASTIKTATAKEETKIPEAAETVKEPEKKPGRKPAAKKAPVKKAAAKTSKELKTGLHVQFEGKSFSDAELLKSAKDVWKNELRKKAGDLTSVELYVKPEENMVYCVFNGGEEGSFSI